MWRSSEITILLTAVTVLLSGVLSKHLKTAVDFHLTECIWDGQKCADVKPFHPELEWSHDVSEWPPGPYALPMAIDGCPEPRRKGWHQGYIDFTWKEPHHVFSSDNHSLEKAFDDANLTGFKDITDAKLPDTQSPLIGPYSRYRVKLNFCFKIKRNMSRDRGSWFDGDYVIYGDKSGCPSGFAGKYKDIQLPKVKHWISDGQLPHFIVNMTNETIDFLQILQCCRKRNDGDELYSTSFLPDNPFILLQYQNNDGSYFPCTPVADMELKEVYLYIYSTDFEGNGSDTSTTEVFLAFCYYFPNSWINGSILVHKVGRPIPKGSFIVRVMDVTTGRLSVDNAVQHSSKQQTTETTILNLVSEKLGLSAEVQWKVLDLGRSMSVVALSMGHVIDTTRFRGFTDERYSILSLIILQEMEGCIDWKDVTRNGEIPIGDKDFPDDTVESIGNECRDPFKRGILYCRKHATDPIENDCLGFRWREKDGKFPRCYVSNGKWDFQHFSAISCKYEVYYEDDHHSKRLHMIFYRSVTGRYITLIGEGDLYSDKSILEKDTQINVLTNVDIFRSDEEDTCNIDLGMSDETIRDHQISASSFKHAFPPTAARPFRFSWCANSTDTDRYIMIDLVDIQKVESITIWNWDNIYRTVSDGSVMTRFLRVGVRSFRLSFGKTAETVSSYDDKIFVLDALYNVDQPQTFVLHQPVYARFVNIKIVDSLTENISCLRFEIHGCRTKEDRSVFPTVAYEATQWIETHINATVLSLSSILTEDAILRSIGYPYGYRNGESYKWIINFDDSAFTKLIFTRVSLNIYQHQPEVDSCDDVILLNEELYVYHILPLYGYFVSNWNIGRVASKFKIDSSFNGKTFMIDTNRTVLTITFTTCQRFGKMIHRGEGFRALVLKQDIPACFTLDIDQRSNVRTETCEMPTMSLSSMSYFNIDFFGTTEKWIIRQNKGYLRFQVIHFNIKCDSGSTFIIADRFGGTRKFCSLQKPPRIFFTSSSSVNVTFVKYSATSKESFRLVYNTVHEIMPETVTTKAANIPEIYFSVVTEAYMNNAGDITKEVSTRDEILLEVPRPETRLLYKVCSRRFDKCYSFFSSFRNWISAGKECWIRQQRLVSIRSPDEMHLVRYILRNFKFLNVSSRLFSTAFSHDRVDFYYAYIGLYRVTRGTDENKFEYWEDKTPVTFSAWKPGEPSIGECTRMGFYKATDNNTWEAIDCAKKMAFYFVCEYHIGSRSIAIQDRVFTADYTGNHSVTIGGFTCQRWDAQYPHKHYLNDDEFFPDASVSDAGNYCRDLSRKRLWCYTTNPDVESDMCYPNELLEDVSPRTYSGRLRYTESGDICKKWTNELTFYNETFTSASDYCRMPFAPTVSQMFLPVSFTLSNLWCYVKAKYGRYLEYCFLPDTASDRCANTHYIYAGKLNVTFSGKECVKWGSLNTANMNEFEFPDKTLTDAENYCRDPTLEGFQWCFTSKTDLTWEPCIIQYGDSQTLEKDHETRGETEETNVFICHSGQLVHTYARCNGLVDCVDASDEDQCASTASQVIDTSTLHSSINSTVYAGLLFLCSNDEFISFLAYCDGIVDCNDASDETDCSIITQGRTGERCGVEYFQCGDGTCIHLSLVCNFMSDCIDSSDEICEFRQCSADEYSCVSGQCISKSQRCDSFTDCLDGSDETNCDNNKSRDIFVFFDSKYTSRKNLDGVVFAPSNRNEIAIPRIHSALRCVLQVASISNACTHDRGLCRNQLYCCYTMNPGVENSYLYRSPDESPGELILSPSCQRGRWRRRGRLRIHQM